MKNVYLMMTGVILTGVVMQIELRADTIDMSGQEPYERCGYCHEYDGNARMAGFPSLAGQTQAYLHKQLLDFRSGRRQGTMQSIAEILTDAEIEVVASYFSSQVTAMPRQSVAVDTRLGRQIYYSGKQQPFVPACVACHGKQAEGRDKNPRLANQLPDYLLKQLLGFKQAQRANDEGAVMRGIAAALSEEEMASLAGFLATLPIKPTH